MTEVWIVLRAWDGSSTFEPDSVYASRREAARMAAYVTKLFGDPCRIVRSTLYYDFEGY